MVKPIYNELVEENRLFWGNTIKNGNLIYPDEHVIRFVKKNYREPEKTTLLDFGCGAGRNTIALLNEHFKVVAIDYTDEAISITREKCRLSGYEETEIIRSSGMDVPIEAESVDGVIANGSLFYNSQDRIIDLLKEIKNVMKVGALIWADFRTVKDSLFGRGVRVSDNCFALDTESGREGSLYWFADEDSLQYVFSESGFKIESLDYYEFTSNNRDTLNSWLHIIARK